MPFPDHRGIPCGSDSATARAAVEQALWRLMSFYDTPLADLDNAIAADPGWALPHTMKAGWLLGLTEPAEHASAAVHLRHAQGLERAAPARERAHAVAVEHLAGGRWSAACAVWDELLIEHPRDALALQWAQLWDFYRGDALHLRRRPSRALLQWDATDPLYPCVLGLLAFGLEEMNLHPQAEEAGRRALAQDPRVPWAVHAVAHVMEMQGRFEEGAVWLRQQQPHWSEGNGFAMHLWWHKGLFRLEGLDVAGVLRLVDSHLAGDAVQITLQRVDAVSLLWRLHLLGADVTGRCAALLEAWPLPDDAAGRHAFNDVHAVLAMLGAGELQRAEAWLARCAASALAPADARHGNHAVARDVGLPLMRGLLAFARGDAAAASAHLQALRPQLQRLGGSHAQRDLVEQTLLEAAVRAGHRQLGRALVNERLMAKPATPLTRHWAQAVGERVAARA